MSCNIDSSIKSRRCVAPNRVFLLEGVIAGDEYVGFSLRCPFRPRACRKSRSTG